MKTPFGFAVFLILFLVLCGVQPIQAAEPGGVYSNRAEGFYLESFCLRKDGKGLYAIAGAAAAVTWRYDAKAKKLIIRGNLGPNAAIEERAFPYDPEQDIIHTKMKSTPGDALLKKIPEEIPKQIEAVLDRFDWNFERHVVGGAGNSAPK